MFLARMKATQLFSPAKINLFLSVLGPRDDGFHELLSLACPLDFGDWLMLEIRDGIGVDCLECDFPGLPLDGSNLILRAVALFRKQHPFAGQVVVRLEKQIPIGAGLGGGSSNAAATLWGLNNLLGGPLGPEVLSGLAATLGSDCPLFLEGGAVAVSGRGEVVEPLSDSVRKQLEGRGVLLLLPRLHVSTLWAYGRFLDMGEAFDSLVDSKDRIYSFLSGETSLEDCLHNNFEPVVFPKFVGLHAVKAMAQATDCGPVLLCGSGSTLFILLPEAGLVPVVETGLFHELRDVFGPEFGLVKARLKPCFPIPFNLR